MKAAVLESARKFVIKDVPAPESNGKDVIMKVEACGLCGSDVHSFWPAERLAGSIFGHEFCGTVADPGDRADLKIGDRICAAEINPCGKCEFCRSGREQLCIQLNADAPGISRPGGYAEYVRVRSDLTRKLPDNVSFLAGGLIEPCAVSLHAAKRGNIFSGARVLVTGAGAIGLFAAACARYLGAGLVVMTAKPGSFRYKNAEQADFVDYVFDGTSQTLSDDLMKLTDGKGFDTILESTSSAAVRTVAIRTLGKGGTFVNIGFENDIYIESARPMILNEYNITGSRFFQMKDFEEVIELFSSGALKLEHFATPVKLDDIQSAFEASVSGHNQTVKYVVIP